MSKCPQCRGDCENMTRKGSSLRYDYCPPCETTWSRPRDPVTIYFEQKAIAGAKGEV